MNDPVMKYDVAIIGGGPGGVDAAKTAGRLGVKVALIEQDRPGGRALWHSLVPSKVWLDAANMLGSFSHMAEIGIETDSFLDNTKKLLERLGKVKEREDTHNREEFEKLNIEVIKGTASFENSDTLRIQGKDDEEKSLKAQKFIIAAGSVPIFPPDLKPDGERILAPRFMSHFETIPESIIVVGGGVTGSETIYLFNRLGSKVTAITDINELLPRADSDISRTLEKILVENGVEFHKNNPAQKISNDGNKVEVTLANGEKFQAEYAFVAIGRKPDVGKLHLENTAVKYSEKSGIRIDKTCRTNAQNIYAIGDVTGPPMLANRASAMGRIAAWNVVNNQEKVFKNKYAVEVVYTEPEVGQVGLNEHWAKKKNVQYSVRRAAYKNNLKANITGHQEGYLKLIIEDHTEKILGASAIGNHAGDLLAPIAVAVKSGLCLDELLQIAPANPTLSELIIAGE